MNEFNFSYMGSILKQARLNAKLTQDELAERVGVTTRYIMAIENEGRCPALDKLFKLIRTLNISADLIFYPEQNSDDNENTQLQRMIPMLNSRDKNIIRAAAQQMLEEK